MPRDTREIVSLSIDQSIKLSHVTFFIWKLLTVTPVQILLKEFWYIFRRVFFFFLMRITRGFWPTRKDINKNETRYPFLFYSMKVRVTPTLSHKQVHDVGRMRRSRKMLQDIAELVINAAIIQRRGASGTTLMAVLVCLQHANNRTNNEGDNQQTSWCVSFWPSAFFTFLKSHI